MRTLVFALALLFCAAPVAHAGGYLAVGMGADAVLGGDLGDNFDTDNMTIGRVGLGTRMGPLAVEGVISGADLRGTSMQILGQTGGGDEFSTTSLGAELKYYLGLSGGIEGFAKAGVNKTWLSTGQGVETTLEYQGLGYVIGGGVQYTFRLLPTVGGAVWLDYNRHMMELNDAGQPTMEGSVDTITLGVSMGSFL